MTVEEFLDRWNGFFSSRKNRERIGRATALVFGMALIVGSIFCLRVAISIARDDAEYVKRNPPVLGQRRPMPGSILPGGIAFVLGIAGVGLIVLACATSKRLAKWDSKPPTFSIGDNPDPPVSRWGR